MNNIGKLHSIPNKENRTVISNNISVAFLGIKLYRKSSHISLSICTPSRSQNRRESKKDRCSARCIGDYPNTGDVFCTLIKLESCKTSDTTGRYNSFGDAFVVEFHDPNRPYLILRNIPPPTQLYLPNGRAQCSHHKAESQVSWLVLF